MNAFSLTVRVTFPTNLIIKENSNNLIYEITKTSKFDSENPAFDLQKTKFSFILNHFVICEKGFIFNKTTEKCDKLEIIYVFSENGAKTN